MIQMAVLLALLLLMLAFSSNNGIFEKSFLARAAIK